MPLNINTVTEDDKINDKMARILNVPDDYELVCFLPIGVAKEEPDIPKKKPFDERAWFNAFGGNKIGG